MSRPLLEILWIGLLPLSWLWGWFAALRVKRLRAEPPASPVISVGNIHSGGSGKTPVVITLAKHFADKKVAILSRGYGSRKSKEGARIRLESAQGATDYGDEPWMLAHKSQAAVFVGQRRPEVFARENLGRDFDLVILDDGFQHVQMGRHVDLVLISAEKDPKASYCLPAGELRENVAALGRASALIITGTSPAAAFAPEWTRWLSEAFPEKPRFFATRRSEGLAQGEAALPTPAVGRVATLCAIADPVRFQRDAAEVATVVYQREFPDHHAYSEKEIDEFLRIAREKGAEAVVTTEKDCAKLEPHFASSPLPLYNLKIAYGLPPELLTFIQEELRRCAFF